MKQDLAQVQSSTVGMRMTHLMDRAQRKRCQERRKVGSARERRQQRGTEEDPAEGRPLELLGGGGPAASGVPPLGGAGEGNGLDPMKGGTGGKELDPRLVWELEPAGMWGEEETAGRGHPRDLA